jgi:hypothetical protein
MRQRFITNSVVMLLFASGAWAQDGKCQEYRAMSQMVLDVRVGTYVGPVYASLGGEVLIDATPGSRVVLPPVRSCNGTMCQERGGLYRFDFGGGHTITVENRTAVYPQPPVFGQFRTTRRIVSGTGRFQNATGLIVESGPFFAWIDGSGVNARYSGEASGTICGVEAQ